VVMLPQIPFVAKGLDALKRAVLSGKK